MREHGKNAYEIRCEILHMAHNDCFDLFQRRLEELQNSKYVDCSQISTGKRISLTEQEITSIYPTAKDIMDRAEELYKFVCKKDI